MAQLRIDFQGRRKIEAFPRARIQAMGNGVQFALRVARQVGPLGQILAQQAIGVLVGAALPRAIRIGKEDLEREPLGQPLVLGHLFPTVIGQGLPQQGGHVPEFLGEALSSTRRIRPVHSGQDDQSSRPFYQGANGRPVESAFEQGAFPVARHRPRGHLGGPRGDRRHIGNLAPSIRSPRPRATCLACLSQRRHQLTAQRTTGQHIQTGIDGFSRQVFAHVVRIRVSEASSNLLGRAALPQMCLDVLPQPRVQKFARSPWVMSSGGRVALRRTGAIGTVFVGGVPGYLTTHGARSSSQEAGKGTEGVLSGQPEAHSLTFFGTQMSVDLVGMATP